MKARLCDRCGKFYMDRADLVETYTKVSQGLLLLESTQGTISVNNNEIKYDLCDNCFAKLKKFLKKEKKANDT